MSWQATLVELVDGRFVFSDAEEFRDECLAKHVLTLPFHGQAPWLADYERLHGKAERERFEQTVLAVHRSRNGFGTGRTAQAKSTGDATRGDRLP